MIFMPRGADGGPPLAGKADAVLVIGLCGGLTESLREQRIVAYTECLSTSPGIVFLNKKICETGPADRVQSWHTHRDNP
jgi:hypothetical protein